MFIDVERSGLMILSENITTGGLIMAPMAGYTDSPFRRIVRRSGAGLVFTELISAEGIVRRNPGAMELLAFTEEERPIGIQIFGKNPAVLAEASRIVEELQPDLIDINMGCCAPKVCSSGSGAALLSNPDLLESIARSVVQSVRVPVSAKIRIGWDERTKNYREIISRLEGSGIAFVSVHGRTRAQKYTGSADWDIITDIAASSSIPVVGNGDIRSYGEAMDRLKSSGCRAVMIGRGAIGNPWIFNGAEPTTQELLEMITCHLDLMTGYYGDYGIKLMRKHMVRYIHGIKNAARLRSELMATEGYDETIAVLQSIAEYSLEAGV